MNKDVSRSSDSARNVGDRLDFGGSCRPCLNINVHLEACDVGS